MRNMAYKYQKYTKQIYLQNSALEYVFMDDMDDKG